MTVSVCRALGWSLPGTGCRHAAVAYISVQPPDGAACGDGASHVADRADRRVARGGARPHVVERSGLRAEAHLLPDVGHTQLFLARPVAPARHLGGALAGDDRRPDPG